jgi:hypothetical protein
MECGVKGWFSIFGKGAVKDFSYFSSKVTPLKSMVLVRATRWVAFFFIARIYQPPKMLSPFLET